MSSEEETQGSRQSPTDLPQAPSGTNALKDQREVIEEHLMQFIEGRVGPAESPLEQAVADNIGETHITQILELNKAKEQNRHTEALEEKKHRPGLILTGLAFFFLFVIGLVWLGLAYSKVELVLPIITLIAGMVTGLIGGVPAGYAYAKHSASSSE